LQSVQSARLHRWAITLSAYDFDIAHQPAKCLAMTDFLSRNTINAGGENNNLNINVIVSDHSLNPALEKSKILRDLFNKEPFITLKNYIINGWPTNFDKILQKYY